MNTISEQSACILDAKLYCGSTVIVAGKYDARATIDVAAVGIHHTDLPSTITQSVNSHSALVEACKAALANLSPIYVSEHYVMKLITAALKKAGAL